MKIVIIGAGNVGTNLQHALELKGIRSSLVSSRDEEQLAALGNDEGQGAAFIYSVADHALAEVIAKVHAPKALHLHTSGSMPVTVFGEDKPHAGVLYFFQSFSKAQLIDDWSGIPCFIEGRNIDDVAAIYSLAQCLTSRIYEANQHDRERLHIAGVFANNYTNLMYRMAAEVLKDTQIPFQALLPLIDQTAAKVHTLTPKDAQTGPASRMDAKVVLHQMSVLAKMKDGEFFASDLQFTYMGLAQVIQTAADSNKPHSIVDILGQALGESDGRPHSRPAQSRRRG